MSKEELVRNVVVGTHAQKYAAAREMIERIEALERQVVGIAQEPVEAVGQQIEVFRATTVPELDSGSPRVRKSE